MSDRLKILEEEQKRLEQLLEECKREQTFMKNTKVPDDFNGYVYVVCHGIRPGNIYNNGGAIISLYYDEKQMLQNTRPGQVFEKILIGENHTSFVAFEDKTPDEGVH